MIAVLMADLDQAGIVIRAHGGRLRYSPRSAVTPCMLNRMKIHKRELLEILLGEDKEPVATPGGDDVWVDFDSLPGLYTIKPCPRCDSLAKWWDLTGGEHCQMCDPPTEARQLREIVANQKKRYSANGRPSFYR